MIESIFARHSTPVVRPDPIPREVIERLLAAAVQAPNHHRNRPWHFVVLTGKARQRLGDVMEEARRRQFPDTLPDDLAAERKKPLRAPVLIAVGIDPPSEEKIIAIENVCSGAAAVQNMLLAAHDLGLGAMWRTGTAASDPTVKAFLGFSPEQELIAFVYVGYPDGTRPPVNRPPFDDRVTWMEE